MNSLFRIPTYLPHHLTTTIPTKTPTTLASHLTPLRLLSSWRGNKPRLSKGERRRRKRYLMRKADERRREPRHVPPAILSRQRQDGRRQVASLLGDPKMDQFKAEVSILVEAISKQPRLTSANRVELPDGTLTNIDVSNQITAVRHATSRRRFEQIQPAVQGLIDRKTLQLIHVAGKECEATTDKSLVASVGVGVDVAEDDLLGREMTDLAAKCRRGEHVVDAVLLAEAAVKNDVWRRIPVNVSVALVEASGRCAAPEVGLQVIEDHLVVETDGDCITGDVVSCVVDGYIRRRTKQAYKDAWRAYFGLRNRHGFNSSLRLYERLVKLSSLQVQPEKAVMLTEEALEFARENLVDEDDVVAHLYQRRELYRSALHACSRSVYYHHLSDKVLEMYLNDTQIEPDAHMLSLTLTCCARAVDVDKAEALWEYFTGEWGVQPDAVAFNSLLNVYARSQWNSTRKRSAAFREVDPFELKQEEVQLDVAPDDEVTAVIERLGRLPPEGVAKGLRRALKEDERLEKKFAAQIEKDNPFLERLVDRTHPEEEEIYNSKGSLIEVFEDEDGAGAGAGAGQDTKSDEWIDMEEQGLYEEAMKAFEVDGLALQNDESSLDSSHEGSDAVTVEPRSRETVKAELMAKLLASRHNVGLGTMAIEAAVEPPHVVQQRNMDKAEVVITEMVKVGIQPDAGTLNNLCRVYALARRINRAEDVVFNRFPSLNLQPDRFSYDALVKMYIRTQRVEKARELVYSLWNRYGVDGDHLHPQTVGRLVDGLARKWQISEALLLLEQLRQQRQEGEVEVEVEERFLRLLRIRIIQRNKQNKSLAPIPDVVGPNPNAWRSKKRMKEAIKVAETRKMRHVLARRNR